MLGFLLTCSVQLPAYTGLVDGDVGQAVGLLVCGSCKVPSLVSSSIDNTGGELGAYNWN